MSKPKMKNIFLFFVVILLIPLTYAITIGCGDEVDINTACVIRTPPITCSTYDLINSTNEININDGSMEEVISGSGVYNFTFNQPDSGIHTIVLCDNSSTQINVETTDETDLGTILSNQATLQNNIETVNQTIKDINDSIILNLSNDFGFFDIFFKTINDSILLNISLSSFPSSVSIADQILIGRQCAVQTLGANLTIIYGYNRSNFFVLNVTYNYTSLGFELNDTFNYDDESYLTNVMRVKI